MNSEIHCDYVTICIIDQRFNFIFDKKSSFLGHFIIYLVNWTTYKKYYNLLNYEETNILVNIKTKMFHFNFFHKPYALWELFNSSFSDWLAQYYKEGVAKIHLLILYRLFMYPLTNLQCKIHQIIEKYGWINIYKIFLFYYIFYFSLQIHTTMKTTLVSYL